MAEEDQRAAREADVAGGDRREAERGEGSNDSRHEQMDSCICSEGIRFLEAAQSPRPSRQTSFSAVLAMARDWSPCGRFGLCSALVTKEMSDGAQARSSTVTSIPREHL